jgi:hypothetical protein
MVEHQVTVGLGANDQPFQFEDEVAFVEKVFPLDDKATKFRHGGFQAR